MRIYVSNKLHRRGRSKQPNNNQIAIAKNKKCPKKAHSAKEQL